MHKENNFDFLRLLAAVGVLFGHSYMLLGQKAPVDRFWGDSCLYIFFVISGYLVTKSYINNPRQYIRNRILRIYPALVVNIFIAVFIIGAIATTLPLAQYFHDAQTYNYILNITAVFYSTYLPGVFKHNPEKFVNGSLWTLGHEVLLYVCILIIGISRLSFKIAIPLVLVLLAVLRIYSNDAAYALRGEGMQILLAPDTKLAIYFMTGAAFYLFVDKYNLLIVAILAALAVGAYIGGYNALANYLVLPYGVLYFAFCDKIKLSNAGRYGDFSYGIYIYAYPVQQLLVNYFGLLPVPQMVIYSLMGTLVLAVLSWHLVEKHALKLKATAHSTPRP